MRTWLKVKLRARTGSKATAAEIELVALANTGYGAARPQLGISIPDAEALGLWPELPEGTRTRAFSGAGADFSAHVLPGAVELTVLAEGREERLDAVDVLIHPRRPYALINAHLLSRLGIAILDPAGGIWAFLDELERRRPSALEPGWS